MPRLSLSFLGLFLVSLDGQPVTAFESLKARGLLAYLAVEAGRPHTREALAGLLWPELPDASARGNLRHALANLRQVLHDHEAHPPFLLSSRETIQFNAASDYALDVAGLQHLPRLATVAQLEEAVELCRGAFLEGFSLGDSPAFEEWLLLRREQFGRLVLSALRRLTDAYAERGDYGRAAACARRQVELEPWDEQAQRQLMRALACDGRRSQALLQYEQCCRVLADELGTGPSAETRALYESIRDGTLREPEPTSAPAFLRPQEELRERAATAVVAREHELARLEGCLDAVLGGQGLVVFVSGDAGSGKTVLLHEFARRAMAAHGDLLVAQGSSNAYTGGGDAYLPFIEVLQMLTGDVEGRWAAEGLSREHALRLWRALPAAVQALVEDGPDLIERFVPAPGLQARAETYARWMAQRAPSASPSALWLERLEVWLQRRAAAPPDQGPPQADILEQYARVLGVLAQRAPLLLLLDDLQWADTGSLSLLFHLGRRLAGKRILIVGAYRPAEVAQGREGQDHPLTPVLNEIQRLWGDTHIDLAEAQGRRFVDELLEREPNRLDEGFRDALFRHTGGHALFTVELLRGLQERGDLVQDRAGRWVVGATLDWERLPARVEAVIAEHMRRLPAPWRALLDAASIEGEEFTAEVVARVRGMEAGDAIQRLSGELTRQHHLVLATSCRRAGEGLVSRYRFRHYLFQTYLYGRLDEVERVHLHKAVGEALEALYAGQPAELAAAAPELARHFEQAGDFGKAAVYLQQAGERAVRLSANLEAIAYLKRGLALVDRLPETPQRAQQELAISLALAGPLMAVKGYAAPEMAQVLSRAATLALDRQLGESLQVFQALGLLGNHYAVRGDCARAVQLFERSMAVAERIEDPAAFMMARAGVGYALTVSGAFAVARPHLEYAVSRYDPAKHRALTHFVGQDLGVIEHSWLAWSLWFLGFPEQALAHGRQAIALAEASEHTFSLSFARFVSGCMLRLYRREPVAARAEVEATKALTAEGSFSLFGAGATILDGWLQVEEGRLEEGIAHMRESLAAWEVTGARSLMPFYYALLAEAERRAGRTEQALALLKEALVEVEGSGERLWEAELHRQQGLCSAASGATAAAEACFRRALAVARAQEARSLELRAAVSLARLWQAQGCCGEALALLSEIYSWFTEGLDTPDLQEAQALLDELSAHPQGYRLEPHRARCGRDSTRRPE